MINFNKSILHLQFYKSLLHDNSNELFRLLFVLLTNNDIQYNPISFMVHRSEKNDNDKDEFSCDDEHDDAEDSSIAELGMKM